VSKNGKRESATTKAGKGGSDTYSFTIVFAFSIKYLWHNMLHPQIDIPNNAKMYIKSRIAREVSEVEQILVPVPVTKKLASKFNVKKLPHVWSSCAASVEAMWGLRNNHNKKPM
jgi:hypothetical protein